MKLTDFITTSYYSKLITMNNPAICVNVFLFFIGDYKKNGTTFSDPDYEYLLPGRESPAWIIF
jgi:hypothetical protein